ncbi:hypothetical protein JX265_007320 [Neoarthrinium moseri]|uniref:Uncharacterized protein n=1 Tax=Neoarthrinium moseri TaxID=1658444 RepID=A0A9P9WK77_9PEZI|nr:uncharacterized protein JN550_009044 [Neoarthrinium moseri]KAI1850995.1 hypothetical protein JX266_003660 [Neoarthrinium moseri]KAI1864024.1 hypothetical protein JN550_009044 [Neoarthrinium moseri]KAI1867518.1 hypothetical protein JX265_007320 [Neoarthrinium moseri]
MTLPNYTDLAPSILRQRLVVEGYPAKPISDGAIRRYLSQLSDITAMRSLIEPVTHKSDLYGWAGWIHWETSGAHFYAWEQPSLFFSVDIYTCKQFDPKLVVDFTRSFFQTTEITARDFSSAPPTKSAAQLAVAPVIKYTLSDPELDALSVRLLSEQPPRTRDALVLYRLEGHDELSNLGRHIERQVFEEKFANTDADMRRIYGSHESVSAFYVVMDQSIRRPVGCMRIMRHSAAGLLSLQEAQQFAGVTEEDFKKYYGISNLETVWDIGTIAIPEQYRGRDEHHIVVMLYRGGHLRGHYEGVTHYIALVDKDLRRIFNMMGWPFYAMAGSKPFEYEGSGDTLAVCGIAKDFFPCMEARICTADERIKPIVQYFAQRFVHGHDIDHRIMFEHSLWPDGTTPLTRTKPMAREARL